MLVISDVVLIARGPDFVADLPVILHSGTNLVTSSNIAADHADASYPASNLANALTYAAASWKSGSTADQYVTITLDGSIESNAIGVARHNWGSGLVGVSVEGYTVATGTWTELIAEQLLGDDTPVLVVVDADFYTGLRLKLRPDAVAPQAAVIYAGPLLTFPRSVQPGHKPLKYARNRQLLNADAMNGDFLGNIVLSQNLASSFDVKLLDSAWWWAYGQPFIDVCREPFFLAWQPDTDPFDVVFAKATNDPQPVISQYTREVDISMQLGGLAL